MKKFALVGAAGYVAPRHMKAIRETDSQLIAALDRNDSVGIIDSYFPNASFFTEFERFERHLHKLKRDGDGIEYLSVCSPNYLHDAHIRFGLNLGADVICEKPLVLNPWNVDALQYIQEETGKKVYTILQLRLHPALVALKKEVEEGDPDKVYDIDLTYITSRGKWYYASWKGAKEKSGGIATNIGIHFFDVLQWIFGDVHRSEVHVQTHDRASGLLELKRARVRWFLSINFDTVPETLRAKGATTYRSMTIDQREIEFSGGFTDLHTESYRSVLEGWGFGLEDAEAAIRLAYNIRNAKPKGLVGDYHPMAALPLASHPFERDEYTAATLYKINP